MGPAANVSPPPAARSSAVRSGFTSAARTESARAARVVSPGAAFGEMGFEEPAFGPTGFVALGIAPPAPNVEPISVEDDALDDAVERFASPAARPASVEDGF